METKHKIFDAVAESRKWREDTSRKLDAMTLEERLAHLSNLSQRYAAQWKGQQTTAAHAASASTPKPVMATA